MIFNQTAAICILRVLLNSWIIITHLRRLLSVGFVIVPKFRGLVICLFNEHLCVHCAYKPKRNWLQIGFTSIILSVLIDWRQILSQKKRKKNVQTLDRTIRISKHYSDMQSYCGNETRIETIKIYSRLLCI